MRVPMVVAGLALAVAGCGTSTGLEPAGLSGVWDAIVLEFSNPDNVDQAVEAYNLGARLSLTIRSDQTYTLETSFPGEADESESGTWAADETTLTLTPTGGTPFVAAATRTGDRLALESEDAEWDWNDDGTPDPANLRIALDRRGS